MWFLPNRKLCVLHFLFSWGKKTKNNHHRLQKLTQTLKTIFSESPRNSSQSHHLFDWQMVHVIAFNDQLACSYSVWQLLGHSCNSLSPDNGVNTQANIQRSQCCRYYWPTVLKTMWRNVCLVNVTDLFVPVVHCFISQHLWPTFAHYLTLTTVWGYMWFFIHIFI